MKKTIFLILFFSLACNSEPTFEPEETSVKEEPETEPQDELPKEEEAKSLDFNFPFSTDAGNCGNPTVAVEFCDWGLAAHDVVLLEVSSVDLVDAPIVDQITQKVIPYCNDVTHPGLIIKGEVKQALNGLSGDISVVLGKRQMEEWNSKPYRDATGVMRWFSDKTAILPGNTIGLTLHKNPKTGTLGILGEHFFDLDENQKIRFADTSYECEEPDPKKVAGNTFPELKQQLQKCTKTTLTDDRIRQKEEAWNHRTFSDLGLCLSRRP